MAVHPRYRIEDGVHCIDVQLGVIERMFDNRDPAPFRERDLDPDLIEYLFAAAEDLAPLGPFKVVFWMTGPLGGDVPHAYLAHMDYELERVDRTRRRQRRTGQVALAIGVTLLFVLLFVARLASEISALREGLTILSWVVMWRPVEVLLYDWLPLRRERKTLSLLRDAVVEVRAGRVPATQEPIVTSKPA